jgi:arylsulfatase
LAQYKGWTAEGGIRNALVVSGPAVKRPAGSINHAVLSVADIMPTLLEVAGASYPQTVNGQPAPPLAGKSWGPLLANTTDSVRTDQDVLAWALFGNRALRQGDWKLRWELKPFGKGQWELYNLAADRTERKDLAAEQPEKLRALIGLWDQYAKANNVILPSRSIFETLEETLPPRVPDDPGYPPLIYKQQFVPPKELLADPKP